MTSKEKVLSIYPEAHQMHRRMLGLTFYVIVIKHYGCECIGDGFSESKAWSNAAKNILAGKELKVFR